MNNKQILLYLAFFLIGLIGNGIFSRLTYSNNDNHQIVAQLHDVKKEVRDKPSPYGRIDMQQIFVYDNEVIIKVKNPQWAIFTDTKSMDPVIDSTSKAIEIIPKSKEDVHVGDIIAYKSSYKEGVVAHRVVEIGLDDAGWYSILKGDNNNSPDPERVRFNQIKRVVVAVIY